MIKNLNVFSDDKERSQYFTGRYYLKEEFSENIEFYQKNKLNLLGDVSESVLQEMQILEILEKLGFPLDSNGTHLYKNMILKAIHHLHGFDDFNNPISKNELLAQMKNPFSQFYTDVARNDLDIGLKTFHANVELAIEDIRYSRADTVLLFDIYSNFSKNTDYGEAALIIGEYITNKATKENKGVIKQITMIPANNIQVRH